MIHQVCLSISGSPTAMSPQSSQIYGEFVFPKRKSRGIGLCDERFPGGMRANQLHIISGYLDFTIS